MTHFVTVDSFDDWRQDARDLLAAEVPPSDVHWGSDHQQPGLFSVPDRSDASPPEGSVSGMTARSDRDRSDRATASRSVPREFLQIAREVGCHRDPGRWELLYRAVWRLTHGERHLLQLLSDDDVHAMTHMRKAVKRDVHKMKAFVRFREVRDDRGDVTMVAWHRPDHRILRLAAPFFVRRFPAMNWSILTPHESVRWDQHALHYGDGVPVTESPAEDALENLWRTYYASIFNPARVKLKAMTREMPVRHWPTLPETRIIPDLLEEATTRVAQMISQCEGFEPTATRFLPDGADHVELTAAAANCRACDLHHDATQTVFGEGSVSARMMIVGEQPGDQEDRAGRPFVGPSGEVLAGAMRQAGIERSDVYLTNVVKHFKFVRRGKKRLHKKPDSREIYACRPWLEAELAVVQPQSLICLGATAAQALIGRDFRITQNRGKIVSTEWCPHTLASWHPAAILRMPDPGRREQMLEQLVRDLSTLRPVGADGDS